MTIRKSAAIPAAVLTVLVLAVPAQAQRGGPPAGVGHGMGAGGGIGMGPAGMPGIEVPVHGSARGNTGWSDGTMPGQSTLHRSAAEAHVSVLERNQRLDTSLRAALTRSGVTVPPEGLKQSCQGFGTLGQCVAALHVAQNTGLPGGFAALKGAMTTGSKLSLGKAIQQLDPSVDAKAELRKANRQASAELDSTAEVEAN